MRQMQVLDRAGAKDDTEKDPLIIIVTAVFMPGFGAKLG